jgi:O-antigen biosynthesis protein
LAFEARSRGFKAIYEPRSTVVHHEYSSSGEKAVELMQVNRLKFLNKWGSLLKKQQRNLWEAPTLGQRESVLVISEITPAPDRSSGGTRLYEFLRLLSKHYHVVLAYLGPESSHEYVRSLERLGVTVFYRGYAKAVHNYDVDVTAILQNNNFKFVFCELFDIAEQFIGAIRQYSSDSFVVIDTYDVHFLREMREAEVTGDHLLKLRAEQTKNRELQIYAYADLVLTVTEADKEALLRENPQLDVAVVSNIHALPEARICRAQRRDLLFVGGFGHRPNIDAVSYFCREILPLVHKRLPDIKLYVVGNAPPAEIIALGSDNVVIVGYVPNLVPYLQAAMAAVVPLRFGSGMKGKIGEAMAYGLPVITTSIGAEGMDLRDGFDAMIADAPDEFAERIITLHENGALWESVARHGRIHVTQEWTPEVVDARLTTILGRVGSAYQIQRAP